MNDVHYHLDGYIAHPGKECNFCEKQVNRYNVSWNMTYDAVSPKDALLQAIAALDDVVGRGIGATVFIVEDTSSREITVLDYEFFESVSDKRSNS